MPSRAFLPIVLAVLSCCIASAQQICPPGGCPLPPAPIVQNWPQEVSVLNWYRNLTYDSQIKRTPELDAEARSYINRVNRITIDGSCGSGSLVGRDADSIWIMTNAHVATSRIGKVVNCEVALLDRSGTERFRAVVVEAAYSQRDTTDWAVVKADSKHLAGIDPIKMSIRMPDLKRPAFTWGCPRCEVPSGQVVRSVGDKPVWQWLPNSIGGQSGSAVIQDGLQCGLLTWTWGGKGAGQFTAVIYQQSLKQTAESSERPDGLKPLTDSRLDSEDLQEGYHLMPGEKPLHEIGRFVDGPVSASDREKQWLAEGLLQEGYSSEAGIRNLPIWADPQAPPQKPDPKPDPEKPNPDPEKPSPGPITPTLPPELRIKLEDLRRSIDDLLKLAA